MLLSLKGACLETGALVDEPESPGAVMDVEAAAAIGDESCRSSFGSLLFGKGVSGEALSFAPGMLSLTGPSTLLATVAS